MSISSKRGSSWPAVASAAMVIACAPAAAAVRTYAVDWTPSAGSESVYISINNLSTGPTSSGTAVAGWDLQIESSSGGGTLRFNFPPSGTTTNPYYGLMRLTGVTAGGGASLANGTIVQASASFADSGPVTFGGGSGQWRLNAENIFGFRFRYLNSQVLHYGYGRIFIGATPGQFRLIELSYQDIGGAAITVVPGPGGAAIMLGAAALGRVGRRRR